VQKQNKEVEMRTKEEVERHLKGGRNISRYFGVLKQSVERCKGRAGQE
jgi:hypothetical protein